MKATKFFVLTMAALAIVACTPKEDPDDVTIKLDKETLNMEVGDSQVLTATVVPAGTAVTWTSLNPAFATVDNGIVTAVAEGSTIIIASAGSARAQCQVIVGKGSSMEGNVYTLKDASVYYPLYVDTDTKNKMGSKVKIDFTVDDVRNHFWPWVIEGSDLLTYVILTPTGKNFYGTEKDGGYMSLSASGNGAGWAGGGYSAQPDELQQLIDDINADPENFYFHIGLRQTDGYGNCFYFFGMEETKFVIGASSQYGGTSIGDFKRDGYWYEFDIPLSKYATAFSGYKVSEHLKPGDDPYIFSFMTDWNGQLNYDALFFYKK